MWGTELPELGFQLGSGVTVWRGRVEEPEMKSQVMGNSPVPFIYLQIV